MQSKVYRLKEWRILILNFRLHVTNLDENSEVLYEHADLFRKNLTHLRSAFADPKCRFRVNRLEAFISQEGHPKVKRKKASDKKENR